MFVEKSNFLHYNRFKQIVAQLDGYSLTHARERVDVAECKESLKCCIIMLRRDPVYYICSEYSFGIFL